MIGRKYMRNFDYESLKDRNWNMDILTLTARIHEKKGRLNLFITQKPAKLERLMKSARIQSTESSNRIEGIVTAETRMKQLIEEKTTPRNRDENEIIGYCNVLNTIHENYDVIPVRSNYILQMHRDMLKTTGLSYAGHYKNVQNYIKEIRSDGKVVTRFTPVAPYETSATVETICKSYNETIAMEQVEPLILIPCFILDFLCIHPFNDGNDRMSRLLTLLLLYQNGYSVGKYISIEKEIEKTKDKYYDALQASDYGWDEGKNDPSPFIRYMLQVILACYQDLEERIELMSESKNKTAYDVVKAYAENHIGRFQTKDVEAYCTGIGKSSIQSSLKKLTEEGFLKRFGTGRATYYVTK